MIKQILENARPVMQISLALFFLVSTGWVVRLYWIEEPIQALGRRLLEKDGALLIKIMSDDRTIGAIRRLTAPSSKRPARPGVLDHLFDRLAAKDGALLKSVATGLLQQPTVQKLLLRPAPTRRGPPPLETLGRYAIDRLLAQDAKLAKGITHKVVGALVPPKAVTSQKVPASWAAIERLGQHALAKLFANRGALALHVTQEIIARQVARTKAPKGKSTWDTNALVKGLGEHAINQLMASRAQSLRAILQSILGPEPMRAMRGLRQIVHQLANQFNHLHIAKLVREAAYQLGRGGLESFLREQQAAQEKEARQQRKLLRKRQAMRTLLRQRAPCFVPRGAAWLSYSKGAITAELHVLHQRRQCPKEVCQAQHKGARKLLIAGLSPLLRDPADLVIQLKPACETITAKPQARPLTKRPHPRRTKPASRKKPGLRPTARRPDTRRPRPTPQPPKRNHPPRR